MKRRVMKQLFLVSVRRFQTGERAVQASSGETNDDQADSAGEKKPLLSSEYHCRLALGTCSRTYITYHMLCIKRPWATFLGRSIGGVGL